MSDEKRSSNLSMNDCSFEINFLLKLEVKLVSAILNIILTIFRKKKYYFSWSIFPCYLLEALMSGALRGSEIDVLWWNEIGVVSDNYCSSSGSERPEESVN
jgi:hypothetical protein